MNDNIVAALRTRLLSDSVLANWQGANVPIGFYFVGARVNATVEPPYIRVTLAGGEADVHEKVTLTFEVFDRAGSGRRWDAYNRIRRLFHGKRLATTGINVPRLGQAHVADGVPDRTVGDVKLVAIYAGEAVLHTQAYET